MKYDLGSNGTEFFTVSLGDVFEYDGKLYIRCKNVADGCNAVSLRDGCMIEICRDTKVSLRPGKYVLD